MKRLGFVFATVALSLLVLRPVEARFFTDATDNFGRTAANLGGNWTESESNGIGTNGSAAYDNTQVQATQWAYYSGSSFSNDQFSQFTWNSGTNYWAATVRMTGSSFSNFNGYYCFYSNGGAYFLGKLTNGSTSDLKTGATGGAVNLDVNRCEVAGTTVTFKINGSTIDSFSDATYGSGSPGIGFIAGSTSTFTVWSGGPIASAGPSFPAAIVGNPRCCTLGPRLHVRP